MPEFEIKDKAVILPKEAVSEVKAEHLHIPSGEEVTAGLSAEEEVSAATLQANQWIIKTCVIAIGNAAYQWTKVEAAKCDDIADPLGQIWAPFIPMLPPITQALLVTITLIAPKVVIVMKETKERKAAKEAGNAPPISPK